MAEQKPSAPAALGGSFDGSASRDSAPVPIADHSPARAPASIPKTAAQLERTLPKVVIVDLRHMGDFLPAALLDSMSRLMEADVHFVLISDQPQAGDRSVDAMIDRGLAVGGAYSILHHQLMSLSHDGNVLYQYHSGGRKLLEPKRFSRRILAAFNKALKNTGLGHRTRSYSRKFSARPKRGRTAQELADAMLAELDKAGIPRDRYALSFVEHGTEIRVQLRPTTLERTIPNIINALGKHEKLDVDMEDVLVVSKSAAILKATDGAVHPAFEAPEADGETLLRACLEAMLAGLSHPK